MKIWQRYLPTWRHPQIFWRCRVSLVKFSYWSKFHVNIITGSGIRTIFVYKGLIRNPDIINTVPSSEFCPISGDWDKLQTPSFAWISPMKTYWMLQNARITDFTMSDISRENWQEVEGKMTSLPTQIRVKTKLFIT